MYIHIEFFFSFYLEANDYEMGQNDEIGNIILSLVLYGGILVKFDLQFWSFFMKYLYLKIFGL